ncbi:sulfotransferase family 2 domain-containing protein [uncultured Tateyamaria sp.]|uniref:sulfotransferase family 2 domain-containing protein n=1 Tax=uncultured Tateyamaria sp. TaxID=455651 RepID=UPI002602A8A4|nr:sulfotransferase family 2 domain-containing protein [uncultured Tateyamaria sp.]
MSEKFTQRLITIRSHPIRYLFIPKCGCTYVKNLIWKLHTGSQFQNPLRIHVVDKDLPRASDFGLTSAHIRNEDYAFTVLRNPVDRFYSLYTDKVVGPGHKMYVPLRSILADKYGLDVSASSLTAHTKNCSILIEWIAENLQSEKDIAKEAHWTPQAYRKNLMWQFDLKLLLVKDLERQLSILLEPIIPNIEDMLKNLERNQSSKDFRREEVVTPKLRKRINEVFSDDRKLFGQVRDQWKAKPHMSSREIPRYREIKW